MEITAVSRRDYPRLLTEITDNGKLCIAKKVVTQFGTLSVRRVVEHVHKRRRWLTEEM